MRSLDKHGHWRRETTTAGWDISAAGTYPWEQGRCVSTTCSSEVGIKLLRSASAAAAQFSLSLDQSVSKSRPASLETRHACGFLRAGALFKYQATGASVTRLGGSRARALKSTAGGLGSRHSQWLRNSRLNSHSTLYWLLWFFTESRKTDKKFWPTG